MSKILDGKIHAMNEKWAYVGYEYETESSSAVLIADAFILMRTYKQYLNDRKYEQDLEEFHLTKFPSFTLEEAKHKPYMLMKFKRIPRDGLDE